MWKQFLALLGLPETATEAEAMAALARRDAPAGELLALTGKANPGEALAVVKAWKAGAEETTRLHAELATMRAAAETNERQALLDAGKREGKVPPAYEPILLKMPIAELKAFLSVMQPVHKPATEPGGTDTTVTVTAAEKEVAAQLGIDIKDLAARKAALGGKIPRGDMTSGAKE